MNKIKFEAYLRDKLSILNKEEIDEIVAEYLQHIDMRVAEGVSEEEAIADFGDLNDLVNDLLDAYKINRDNRNYENFENRMKALLNSGMDFINNIANSIMKRSSGEVVGLIVEFVFVIFAVSVANWLIGGLFGSVSRAFYFRPYFLTSLIRLLVGLVRVLLTTSFSIAIFYWFAKERILNKPINTTQEDLYREVKEAAARERAEKEEKEKEASEVEVGKTENSKDEALEENVVSEELKATMDNEKHVKTIVTDKPLEDTSDDAVSVQAKNRVELPIQKKKSFGQKVVTFNVTIIRVIVGLILIPTLVIGVLMGIAYGFLLVATFSGYGSIGISIIGAGFLLMYYYITIVFIKFVGGKKA